MTKCPDCGNEVINGRCVRFTQHKSPEREKKLFIGHAVRLDPHGDKEDTRPREKRGKPRLTLTWEKPEEMAKR